MLYLSWFRPQDNCNSFTSFSVYGRDDVLNTFQLLGIYSSFSLDNVSIKLKNLKSWQFYIVYNKACNGIDSIYSDTVSIDNTAPFNSQIDSVSVDPVTQKTIIGWSRNASPDIKGYTVFYVNPSSKDNEFITNTTNIFYQDGGARNPAAGPVKYGIAAFDSCDNTSLISIIHSTVFLEATYNECPKTIKLEWSPYKGWESPNPLLSYEIFLKTNSGTFQKIGSFDSSFANFTYKFPDWGDSYCFFIRAIRAGGTVTSSSNIVCVSTNSVIPSRNSYVAKASVQNNEIELTLVAQTGTSMNRINIYKAEGNKGFSLWQTVNTTGGVTELKDNNVNVHNYSYRYFFTTEGLCSVFDTSQTAKTILLNATIAFSGSQNINWTLYDDFIKSTQGQQLLLSNSDDFNKSSTWNILSALDNTTKFASDNTEFSPTQEKICYCVRAIENPPQAPFNRQDTSYSNIQCLTPDPIVYFPNAIYTNGFNTVFYPKGVFIDNEKSSFVIYNRWGEVIFETNDISTGWDGKQNNSFVQSDVYMYRATIVGLNGKTLFFNGTITVLK